MAMSVLGQSDLPVHLFAGRSTSRSASATSARCWRRPTRTAASCSPGRRRGLISTNAAALAAPAANGTIFDRLDAHNIEWAQLLPADRQPSDRAELPQQRVRRTRAPVRSDQFFIDAAAGKLPQFTFLDPNYDNTSEENPQDIQVGERFVAKVVKALMHSPTWKNTALFLTYDEHGGYYDHVPPPPAIMPDNIEPTRCSASGDAPGPITATASACR